MVIFGQSNSSVFSLSPTDKNCNGDISNECDLWKIEGKTSAKIYDNY